MAMGIASDDTQLRRHVGGDHRAALSQGRQFQDQVLDARGSRRCICSAALHRRSRRQRMRAEASQDGRQTNARLWCSLRVDRLHRRICRVEKLKIMSFFPAKDPVFGDARSSDAIAQIIVPRSVDLGGLQVRRALPSARSRMVGPFIFFDHFGPAVFRVGDGIDVRPHPHIGLATVTYLFDGEIVHRDSLGSAHADPARRRQLDDRRPRHRSFRAHRPRPPRRRRAAARLAIVGRAAESRTKKRPRPSRTRRPPISRKRATMV